MFRASGRVSTIFGSFVSSYDFLWGPIERFNGYRVQHSFQLFYCRCHHHFKKRAWESRNAHRRPGYSFLNTTDPGWRFFRFPFAMKTNGAPCTHLFYIHTNELLPLFKTRKVTKSLNWILKSVRMYNPTMFQKQKRCHFHSLSLCHTQRISVCLCFDLFTCLQIAAANHKSRRIDNFVETFW